jgi:hypothetical protein
VVRISFALINISHKPEAINSFRFVPLGYDTLAHPPKSEFVEKERRIKSLLFRHIIYVTLRTTVAMCKNLPFTSRYAQKPQKNTKFICPLLDISVSGSPIIHDGKLVGAVTHVLVNDPTTGYGIFIIKNLTGAVCPCLFSVNVL